MTAIPGLIGNIVSRQLYIYTLTSDKHSDEGPTGTLYLLFRRRKGRARECASGLRSHLTAFQSNSTKGE